MAKTMFGDVIVYNAKNLVSIYCFDSKIIMTEGNNLGNCDSFSDDLFRKKVNHFVVKYTSEQMLKFLDYIVLDTFQSSDIRLLSKMTEELGYFDSCRDEFYILKEPKDIEQLHPGSEDHFEGDIIQCYNKHKDNWPKNLKISDKSKRIIIDEISRNDLSVCEQLYDVLTSQKKLENVANV